MEMMLAQLLSSKTIDPKDSSKRTTAQEILGMDDTSIITQSEIQKHIAEKDERETLSLAELNKLLD